MFLHDILWTVARVTQRIMKAIFEAGQSHNFRTENKRTMWIRELDKQISYKTESFDQLAK